MLKLKLYCTAAYGYIVPSAPLCRRGGGCDSPLLCSSWLIYRFFLTGFGSRSAATVADARENSRNGLYYRRITVKAMRPDQLTQIHENATPIQCLQSHFVAS
ncbi:hypothetical protein ACU8KH_05610 [Lachancea thermotolerans]